MSKQIHETHNSNLLNEDVAPLPKQLRSLLEGSPVCNKIIDLESRLRYMSSAGQQQLNIKNVEALYGSTFPPDFYPEPWRTKVAERLAQAKAGNSSSLECPVLDSNGIPVWYDTTFVPARDDSEEIQYIIVTSVNITERKRAEDESRQHIDELAHVSRLSTMGELTTGIAHELSQPLAALTLYSTAASAVAQTQNAGNRELQDILEKIEDQALRAGEIVRRLRDFVSKKKSNRTWTDINTLLLTVAKLVEPDFRAAHVTLCLKLDESSPRAPIDDIQIQQVVVNLVTNAIAAIKEEQIVPRTVTISSRVLDSGEVEVVVSDTGIGIGEADLDRIFDSFYSTKPNGLGMGLPISRSIVKSHNGRIWVESKVGEGTTFGFTIPGNQNTSIEEFPSVYVVDDEAAIRDSLSAMLRLNGITVRSCSSAANFLEAIESLELAHPICLVADIQMPKMNGIDLLRRLREMNADFPKIMMTGHADEEVKAQSLELGAVKVIEKPFVQSELVSFIKESLARK